MGCGRNGSNWVDSGSRRARDPEIWGLEELGVLGFGVPGDLEGPDLGSSVRERRLNRVK